MHLSCDVRLLLETYNHLKLTMSCLFALRVCWEYQERNSLPSGACEQMCKLHGFSLSCLTKSQSTDFHHGLPGSFASCWHLCPILFNFHHVWLFDDHLSFLCHPQVLLTCELAFYTYQHLEMIWFSMHRSASSWRMEMILGSSAHFCAESFCVVDEQERYVWEFYKLLTGWIRFQLVDFACDWSFAIFEMETDVTG